MPEKRVIEKARKARRQGKSPSTQAGEFVKKEIEDIRKGKHGARSVKQAIAIGLSEARKAGVKLPPPPGKKKAKPVRHRAKSSESSLRRAKATLSALRKEPHSTVSPEKLAAHTRAVAKRRGPAKRHASAMKAVHTKGHAGLRRAAQKAAQTRKEHRR